MGRRALDIKGERFTRLVAVEWLGTRREKGGGPASWWLCKCDCGNTVEVRVAALRAGLTKSCGCLNEENKISAEERVARTNATALARVSKAVDRAETYGMAPAIVACLRKALASEPA